MRPSIARRAEGHHGIAPISVRPDYATYKSPYGPQYRVTPNIRGINLSRAAQFASTAAAFGAVGGLFALYFFSDVPKVRKDILQRMPIVGDYFVKEVAPEDNPF